MASANFDRAVVYVISLQLLWNHYFGCEKFVEYLYTSRKFIRYEYYSA